MNNQQEKFKGLKPGSFLLDIEDDKIRYIINGVSLRDILYAMENIPELYQVAHSFKMRHLIKGEIERVKNEL